MTTSATQLKLLALAMASAISAAAMGQDAPRIEEIAVIGQFVPDEKRATSSVSNVLGQEQFQRSGDANIAEGLKRVSGLSTVGGKFVYVRGLGERYSTTLMNGAIMPSPEPINRVVPLDLFPTAVLDSVLVQKTYSAQFPSEFGGGVLQLRTKKSTDEFFWNITSSAGLQQDTSFKDGFTSSSGSKSWLGYDDDYRGLPTALQQATAGGQELRRESQFLGSGGYTPAELQEIGRSMRNDYKVEREALPADFKFATSVGNFHELNDNGAKINYLAAINYSNSWDTNEIERNAYRNSDNGLEIGDDLDFIGTQHSVDISSIITAGLDINANHNIRTTSMVLRTTDDTVSETTGDLAEEDFVRLSQLEWIERELFSNQVQGDHYFPDFNELVVNWRYSKIKAERDAPDDRVYRYDQESDGNFRFSTRADGNVRRFSTLDDDAQDFAVDLAMVFYGPMDSLITTKTGYVRNEKQRDSEVRRYSFFDQGSIAFDEDLLTRPLEEILAPRNIDPDGFELREFTRPTDNYVATNESEAFYAEVELNFDDRYRIHLGARQEDFAQNVRTFDLFRDAEIDAAQESKDILPAFTGTYINGDHQFRIAYSETLSRPDFRELSPAAFTNPVTGREVVGNPDLKIANITNYDFRWEWYFGFGDSMSLGLFYKEFENPIESVVQPGADVRQTFANAEAGENAGVEFEFTKRLDFLGGRWEDFYVQSNVAFIDSEVTIAEADRGILTSTSRPLQGQSDWLFNAQLGYEPFSGTTATLLYHYYGERISEVGIEGAPDLIEQPFGELNTVFIHEFNEAWRVTLKGKNLLDQRSEITQGGLVTTGFNRGREVSVQMDYRF
ncbi:MAG: TonB-dependent receptor [Pseudohongiella sp.]|nr:MAG: TonB-dependent receptor [Pseudohongiella sp.]